MPTSKLFWNAELNQLEVEVTNSKKVTTKWACPIDQLALNVPRTISENDNIEVDFDRDPAGKIVRVRLTGETWQSEKKAEIIDYKGIKEKAIEDAKNAKSPFKKGFSDKPKETPKEVFDMPKDFHNPYNFVPAIPRESVTGELADREPIGHDRFDKDYLSGKLTVKMTVETPLVVLDTARMSLNANDPKHKQFPVRIENGKPFINPTAVKGMLRSAYEAVTNSRLSVFTKHEDKLAFRMNPKEALDFIPVRIEENSGGQKQITFYTGKFDESMPAAWLGKYGTHNSGNYNNLDTHRRKVWAYIEVWEHKIDKFKPFRDDNVFYFWNVIELQDANVANPTLIQPNIRTNWNHAQRLATPQGQWVEGFVCKTKQNIRGKHDERVFFKDTTAPAPEILSDSKWANLKDKWRNLIENYQEEHANEDNPPPHSGASSWSRQIKGGKSETILETGTLCYAKVKEDTTGKFEVLELFPVMISRRLHQNSPADLLDPTLKPAKSLSQLSPADRVFGWVGDGVKKNGNYRGQVRFGSVVCKTDNAIQDFDNLPLNILGQPKPQQGRFYVAKDNQGNAQERSSDLTNEKAGYKEGKGLRGRKVYPHHNLPENYWITGKDWKLKEDSDGDLTQTLLDGKYFREYIRPKGEKRTDSQNRSIQGWVKPQTEFEFDIHFTNLSEVELGALVWLLSMDEKHFHRFGGGKPLGFGSVKLSVKNSEITSGKDLIKFYGSLDSTRNRSKTPEDCKAEFEKVANIQILNSFKAACKGFDNELPTHYPRARRYKQERAVPEIWIGSNNETLSAKPIVVPPHSEGLAYEWFVANNKTERGELKNAYVLKNILDDDGLPILDHRK